MSPTGDDVRRQLDRLLASSGFANAVRMSRFLKFVVEHTLAGEGERLKEYVIGVEVFDRDTSYDPHVDSIVRVEAARLRTKLAEYYAGKAAGTPSSSPYRRAATRPSSSSTSTPARSTARPSRTALHRSRHRPPPTQRMPRSAWRAWAVGALSAVTVVRRSHRVAHRASRPCRRCGSRSCHSRPRRATRRVRQSHCG